MEKPAHMSLSLMTEGQKVNLDKLIKTMLNSMCSFYRKMLDMNGNGQCLPVVSSLEKSVSGAMVQNAENTVEAARVALCYKQIILFGRLKIL